MRYNKMGGVQEYNPVLSMIKFPLACLVIVLHLGLPNQHDFYPNAGLLHITEEITGIIEVLFSKYIVHLAVPTFFAISGYLFFKNVNEFTRSIYLTKIKSRFMSVLVPYILWNFLYLVFLLFMKALGVIAHGNDIKGIMEFIQGNGGWCNMMWSSQELAQKNILGNTVTSYFPINAPLWFLRDLYIAMLLSPILYFLAKKTEMWFIAVMACLYYLQWQLPFPGFSITAIFFFSLGALVAIKKYDLVRFSVKYKNVIYSLTLILIPILFIQKYSDMAFPVFRLLGVFALLAIFSSLSYHEKLLHSLEKMTEFSMFVFVAQYFFLDICRGFLIGLVSGGGLLRETFLYVITPVFIISLMWITYIGAKKVCPKSLSFTLGNRKQ